MTQAVAMVAPALAFVFGLTIGSFLNVCIIRWPEGMSVIRPPSRCPRCGRRVRWSENIPVASWLALRGRCRGCAEPISHLYPVVELSVGAIWLASVLWLGPSFVALRLAVFGTVMLGIALTDARSFTIPDGFTVFGLIWVLATSVAGWLAATNAPFAEPAAALIGACAGAGAIAITGWVGEVLLRREAMGFGDVTLMAVVGAAVGPWRALLTIFVAALLAVLLLLVLAPFGLAERVAPRFMPSEGREPGDAPPAAAHNEDQLLLPITRQFARGELGHRAEPRHLPFGVFLAPAAVATLLWGDVMIRWYLSLTGVVR